MGVASPVSADVRALGQLMVLNGGVRVAGEFGPSKFITTALAAGTFSPALLILAVRQLWPQGWASALLAATALVGVTVSVWFFRRSVPACSSSLWAIHQVHPVSSSDSLLSVVVVPCLIALVCPPSLRWGALAVLLLFGVIAARTTMLLTNNIVLVAIGLNAYRVDVSRPSCAAGAPRTVTLLAPCRATQFGDRARLIDIGHGVYVQATGVSQEPRGESS